MCPGDLLEALVFRKNTPNIAIRCKSSSAQTVKGFFSYHPPI